MDDVKRRIRIIDVEITELQSEKKALQERLQKYYGIQHREKLQKAVSELTNNILREIVGKRQKLYCFNAESGIFQDYNMKLLLTGKKDSWSSGLRRLPSTVMSVVENLKIDPRIADVRVKISEFHKGRLEIDYVDEKTPVSRAQAMVYKLKQKN